MNLQSPLFRWGVGLYGGAVIAAVALLFLEGTMQLLVLGIAVVDVAFTPLILKHAMES